MFGDAAEIRSDLEVVTPDDDTMKALYTEHIIDDPEARAAYTDDLPDTASMLERRRSNFPGVAVYHRGVFSGFWFLHDVADYPHVYGRVGWTCGLVARDFRGPSEELQLFRSVQMAYVIEIFFEIMHGVHHLLAGVMANNPGGNAWARRIGFTFVGTFDDWLMKNGVLVPHNIYCWWRRDGVLAWNDANRRSKGGVTRPTPRAWQ